ncbi:glucan biosynthesis protein [Sphingomonas oligoaromativorans]|uniref:glucan biosynthesis protein n=1 Tax=Sphingomonas oligoaromativorans TaxID=575322 RepID=UPI001FB9AB5A|nr:glucan biosynthesis protein [Sphingomonas oligoaromativorans]NIJ32821.1 glucans biosynthesis protein [Sphingomonas oligoaromativorans]
MTNTTRRDLLAALGAVAALPSGRLWAAATRGEAHPFSWERLKADAAALARRPWTPPPPPPVGVGRIDYDALNSVQYKAAATQLRGPTGGGVRFFPINHFQPTPVEIFLVEGNMARPFHYSPALFDMPADSPLAALGSHGGFSGFRAMNAAGTSDWLAFAGASYFRSAGALDQYGLSARGISINSGGPETEEFPAFTRFWLGRGADGSLLVDALLEGPSVVGAYRFTNRKTDAGVIQDVELTLHLRRDIARLGLAPLTSMFWYDQAERARATDWRPEIHDSDGLLILNGSGERLWRPLSNPNGPTANSFADHDPRGFGLLQRDHKHDHYQDDGVFYEKRPSLWVEPRGDWGAGSVMLVELPTSDETNDNIVAFWTPAEPAKAGQRIDLSYRLRWIAGEPLPEGPARVVDDWRGAAGRPGQPVVAGATKIVIDFEGSALRGLGRSSGVRADLSVGRGKAEGVVAYPVVGQPDRWRLMADITPEGREPVDIRAALRQGSTPLTEVCLAQIPGQ